MNIYISRNGIRLGPYTVEQLQDMIESEQLSLSDKAWYEDCAEWTRVSDMPELVNAVLSPSNVNITIQQAQTIVPEFYERKEYHPFLRILSFLLAAMFGIISCAFFLGEGIFLIAAVACVVGSVWYLNEAFSSKITTIWKICPVCRSEVHEWLYYDSSIQGKKCWRVAPR